MEEMKTSEGKAKEMDEKMAQVFGKAWTDEEFKRRLIADPSAALRENGLKVAEGMEVRVVENTDKIFYLVIPPRPELSDEELDKVAGGAWWDVIFSWRPFGFITWA